MCYDCEVARIKTHQIAELFRPNEIPYYIQEQIYTHIKHAMHFSGRNYDAAAG